MRQTLQRSISLLGIALVSMVIAMGAPKTERAKSEITVYGRVLKIDIGPACCTQGASGDRKP